MCPCCMYRSNTKSIKKAVEAGLAAGEFEAPVRWCSHIKGEKPNSQMSVSNPLFILGDAIANLAEIREAIHTEAEKQIAAGNIKLQANRTSQF